jgi:hypothetical protein
VGEIALPTREPTRRPFNSPLENGLRSLFLLDATAPRKSDLQRLIFYDYLLVHSADPEGGPPSLHAAVPYRSGEWMVRRRLVSSGLDLMFAKELVEKTYESSGVMFGISELTQPFILHLKSPYSIKLRELADWVSKHFGSYSDEELRQYMIRHLGRWGAEFSRDSILRRVQQ